MHGVEISDEPPDLLPKKGRFRLNCEVPPYDNLVVFGNSNLIRWDPQGFKEELKY